MNYSDFDETDLEIAKEELNEITEKKEEKILEVKKLCKNSDKIQSFCHERLDDQFLLRFLRCEKFRVEDAVSRIEKYFEIQSLWPEVYNDFTFESIKGLIQSNLIELMPKCDEEGCALLVLRIKNWDTSKYTHHELYKSIIFVNEFMLLHDRVQIRGIKLLANLEGGSFNHFRNLDRRAMKMWGKTTGKTIPLRLKKMALINVPIIFNVVISFFRKIIGQKMKDRVVSTTGNDASEFDKKCLPKNLVVKWAEKIFKISHVIFFQNRKKWNQNLHTYQSSKALLIMSYRNLFVKMKH